MQRAADTTNHRRRQAVGGTPADEAQGRERGLEGGPTAAAEASTNDGFSEVRGEVRACLAVEVIEIHI
jgi:hypothetical protein